MSTVNELLRELESLPAEDRRKVIDWIVANPASARLRSDLVASWIPMALSASKDSLAVPGSIFGIETDPEICGGEPRIVRTRIPIWTLEQMRRQRISEADILKSYPALRAEDLVNAWRYVDAHRPEIESQIRENEEQAVPC